MFETYITPPNTKAASVSAAAFIVIVIAMSVPSEPTG